MNEPGDKLERSYRGLAREEPPSALDASILEASRRAIARPAASRRWALPVSIAAVLMLAVGVTFHMREEQPGIETSTPPSEYAMPSEEPPARDEAARPDRAPAPEAQAPAPAAPSTAAKTEGRAKEKPAIQPAARKAAPAAPPALPAAEPRPEQATMTTTPAQVASPQAFPAQGNLAPAPAAAPAEKVRSAPATPSAGASADAAPAPAGAAPAIKRQSLRTGTLQSQQAGALAEPERELERIAQLRAQGRHAEADKALEEFRRAHPDYRIAEAMWERVRPR